MINDLNDLNLKKKEKRIEDARNIGKNVFLIRRSIQFNPDKISDVTCDKDGRVQQRLASSLLLLLFRFHERKNEFNYSKTRGKLVK